MSNKCRDGCFPLRCPQDVLQKFSLILTAHNAVQKELTLRWASLDTKQNESHPHYAQSEYSRKFSHAARLEGRVECAIQ
jgi:hypothetical protein